MLIPVIFTLLSCIQNGHRHDDEYDIDRLDLKASGESKASSSSSSSHINNGMSKESRIADPKLVAQSNRDKPAISKTDATNDNRNGNVYFLAGQFFSTVNFSLLHHCHS